MLVLLHLQLQVLHHFERLCRLLLSLLCIQVFEHKLEIGQLGCTLLLWHLSGASRLYQLCLQVSQHPHRNGIAHLSLCWHFPLFRLPFLGRYVDNDANTMDEEARALGII